MYIYRIEHKEDKRGMFNSRYAFKVDIDMKQYSSKGDHFTAPQDDPLLGRRPIQHREFCAFKSYKVFKTYISKDDFKLLKDTGFKLLRIRIDNCIVGKEQVLYQRKNILSCKDITNTIKY